MAAARSGDTVPLLRLGADNDPAHGFGSDLREFSAGHGRCAAASRPSSRSTRAPGCRPAWRQFARAYAQEPAFYGTSPSRPGRIPATSASSRRPASRGAGRSAPCIRRAPACKGVPTLVLGGEYDLPVPEAAAKLALRVMRGASYVGIAAAGHDPQFWSDCGPELVQRFYADRAVGDTSCARQRAGGWWVPGVLPDDRRQRAGGQADERRGCVACASAVSRPSRRGR